MSDTVISVKNLSKEYTIGSRKLYPSFRDMLAEKLSAPFRRKDAKSKPTEKIWALKDISFDVKKGEILGIIGKNGAGKSTLLKIMSRITQPTTGRVSMRGRVSSLLEVGTGFHPDLTGRENIYLNGTILGMKKAEIDKRYDEIVAFSEVKKFIHTPIKHYSSGMYVRLAFAVAAHLEAEILLVDEVLAVGDLEFQRKCLGRIRDISGSGRTVIFISHNMSVIENLCDRALLIDQGRLTADGSVTNAITHYLSNVAVSSSFKSFPDDKHKGVGQIRIKAFRAVDKQGESIGHIPMGSDVTFEMNVDSEIDLDQADFQVIMHTHLLQPATLFSSVTSGHKIEKTKGKKMVRCHIPELALTAGRYYLTLAVYNSMTWECYDELKFITVLDVYEKDVFKSGRMPDPEAGPCYFPAQWEMKSE